MGYLQQERLEMGSVSAPDCPTEPRVRWIHFLGSKKNRKNDGKAQKRGVPKNNKGKVEWRWDGSTGKINKDETNILVLPRSWRFGICLP